MLYVIENDYFLTHYILDKLECRADVRVIKFARAADSENLVTKVSRYIVLKTKRKKNYKRYFDKKFVEQISVIEPSDKVLFFGVENQKDLIMLSSLIVAKSKSLWVWNSVFAITRGVVGSETYSKTLLKAGVVGYTFDSGDAQRYGLQLTRQVYARVNQSEESCTIEQDLFFIGCDKKRIDMIYGLMLLLDGQHINYRIEIVPDSHKKYDDKHKPLLINSSKSYTYTIRQIRQSRAVLDILQPNQSGSTLRPLEALFLGKKLVTNNLSVVNEPYYDSRYIFVIGVDDMEKLGDFIKKEQPPYSNDIIETYEINTWINQFV